MALWKHDAKFREIRIDVFRARPGFATLVKAFELAHVVSINHGKFASWECSMVVRL